MNTGKSFWRLPKLLIFILLVFCTQGIFSEEEDLTNAWKAFNNSKYIDAIKYADSCISKFSKDADKIQKKLYDANTKEPPTGSVTANEKTWIFSLGLLNDVATSLYIKGRSAEYLFEKGDKSKDYKKIAEDSYQELNKYKYGRTWDPKGWFWSPYEAACNRLPL
jgi:hypothetical protein